MLRFLVVDDEPTIVEGVYDSLASQYAESVDVCKAYTATEAYRILLRYPVDIMISDIRMPGLSGIDLLKWVETYRPRCRVILLTGYDMFSYAQEALRYACCVDYLLKNQGDDALMAAVDRQVEVIAAQNAKDVELTRLTRARNDHLKHVFRHHALRAWLTEGKAPPQEGCSIDVAAPVVCAAVRFPGGSEEVLIMDGMLGEYVPFMNKECLMLEDGVWIWLMQPSPSGEDETQFENRIYAGVQQAITAMDDMGVTVAVVLGKISEAPGEITARMLDCLSHFRAGDSRFISLEDAEERDDSINGICEYVRTHISDHSLSLITIAEYAHYNPSYLSRYFKKKTGQNLMDYVNDMRLKRACELLDTRRYTINEVTKQVGFVSQSYLTMFFKRRLCMTPSEYQRSGQARDKM